MSLSLHKRFKGHISSVCFALEVRFGEFARAVSLPEFLMDMAEEECAKTFAAHALAHLVCDGTGPSKYVPCIATIQFLNESFRESISNKTLESRLKQLKEMVDNGEDESAYRVQIDGWYS